MTVLNEMTTMVKGHEAHKLYIYKYGCRWYIRNYKEGKAILTVDKDRAKVFYKKP